MQNFFNKQKHNECIESVTNDDADRSQCLGNNYLLIFPALGTFCMRRTYCRKNFFTSKPQYGLVWDVTGARV